MTDPLAKGYAEEGALEIHTNVLDLIIIKFICMVMCFKWSLLPTTDKQSTKLSLSRGRRRSRRLREVCRIKSVNIPCSNGSLELLGVGLETGRQTAGTQTLAELTWAELSFCEVLWVCAAPAPRPHPSVAYRYVMCLSLFVVCYLLCCCCCWTH